MTMPKANHRENLIEAALQLLQVSGFNGCSVQDITEAAGAPKGSFYNHFDSKEALALHALERFWELGTTRREILKRTDLTPHERIREHFRTLSAVVTHYNFKRGCLIGNFSAEMPASTLLSDKLSRIYSLWGALIEECILEGASAGAISPSVPAKTVASFLISSWEGCVLKSKIVQNKEPLDEFDAMIFQCLLK